MPFPVPVMVPALSGDPAQTLHTLMNLLGVGLALLLLASSALWLLWLFFPEWGED